MHTQPVVLGGDDGFMIRRIASSSRRHGCTPARFSPSLPPFHLLFCLQHTERFICRVLIRDQVIAGKLERFIKLFRALHFYARFASRYTSNLSYCRKNSNSYLEVLLKLEIFICWIFFISYFSNFSYVWLYNYFYISFFLIYNVIG